MPELHGAREIKLAAQREHRARGSANCVDPQSPGWLLGGCSDETRRDPTIHEIRIVYSMSRKILRENHVILSSGSSSLDPLRSFAFLTNHGLVLLCIADNPGVRMRDIAAQVNITERAAQRIVADLSEAGYLDRERVGRRNRYTIQADLPISLPDQRDVDLNSLLNVLLPGSSSAQRKDAMPAGDDHLAATRGKQPAPASPR